MYTFVNRDESSSVYNRVVELLLSSEDREWKQVHENSARFNLMFGERKGLDFTRLGHISGMCQAVNYYRGSENLLCRKVPLVKLVRSLAESEAASYQWIPVSFIVLPKQLNSTSDSEKRKKSTQYTDEREELTAACNSLEEKIWIAKSSSGAKGKDILISDDIEAILSFIDQQKQGFVVQKYIENPLLLQGDRKFDVRCWVLLDHNYDIHVFSEGVLRTTSEPYDASNLKNVTSHLTNHCVQEAYSANFGQYEEGNEMFFHDFSRYLQEEHQVSFTSKILPQIHFIVEKCLLGLKEELTTEGLGYHSFQLFGFDFMIDTQYKVWLLEVNGAPACAKLLLQDLVLDLVRKAIDPIFHRPTRTTSEDQYCSDQPDIKTQDVCRGMFLKI